MLRDAGLLATQLSGQGSMWQNPFAHPDPRAAVERAQVWFTAYPLSFISRPGDSFLAGLANPELWKAFRRVGIDAVHTGPVKLAGGIKGWNLTGSVDGHFDRISMQVDPAFGTEDQFRSLCEVASAHNGTVIDDIVPGHTGKGSDFRLAEMGFSDYPGIYHMVSIAPEDWHLLPDVPDGPRFGQPRRGRRDPARRGRLHHRAPAAGDLLRGRGQGDQLERDRGRPGS